MPFPTSIDTGLPLKKDTPADPKRALESRLFRQAIIALQQKVGVDNSTDTNSLDYKVGQGGNGGTNINIKSGQSIGAKQTEVQVDFVTAFPSTPSVAISAIGDKGAWLTEVNTDYFKWDNNSKNTDVTINWIATDAGDN